MTADSTIQVTSIYRTIWHNDKVLRLGTVGRDSPCKPPSLWGYFNMTEATAPCVANIPGVWRRKGSDRMVTASKIALHTIDLDWYVVHHPEQYMAGVTASEISPLSLFLEQYVPTSTDPPF